MPKYLCPECGKEKTLLFGNYTCKECGIPMQIKPYLSPVTGEARVGWKPFLRAESRAGRRIGILPDGLNSFDTTKPRVIESRHRGRTISVTDKKALTEEAILRSGVSRVGMCYFFENIVVFGDPEQLGKRIKGQLGEFLGKVYCKMPYDPYYVLYQRLKNLPSWTKRKGDQKAMDKWIYPGKPIIYVNGKVVEREGL